MSATVTTPCNYVIYSVICSTGARYIGSTSIGPRRRWQVHTAMRTQVLAILARHPDITTYAEYRAHGGTHTQPHIIEHILAHPAATWEFTVLQECPGITPETLPTLREIERDHIILHGTTVEQGGLNAAEGTRHSAATRAKMSASHMGKIVSAETRERMRQARLRVVETKRSAGVDFRA